MTASENHQGGPARFHSREYTPDGGADAPPAHPPTLVLTCTADTGCKTGCEPVATSFIPVADAHASALISIDGIETAPAEGLAGMLAVNATAAEDGVIATAKTWLAYDLTNYDCSGTITAGKLELKADEWPKNEVTLSLYALTPGALCIDNCDLPCNLWC